MRTLQPALSARRPARWHASLVPLVLALILLLVRPAGAQEPAAVFLTWSEDPTTTVTVDWHLLQNVRVPAVQIRKQGDSAWKEHAGDSIAFPHSSRTVRRARIGGLEPGSMYELRFANDGTIYRYRSMPARNDRPIRFATGGDTQFSEESFGRTNRAVAKYDLDFVVFGGDLSYANGDPRRAARKEEWFETITRTLITGQNRLIPVVVAIGNHEVWEQRRLSENEDADQFMRQWGVSERQATYFSPLFDFPGDGTYGVLDFGNYLSILLLDTGHMAEVEGNQTAWLASTLSARTQVPHVFPVYHVPAYPSVRSFEGSVSRKLRENWVPLFELHGVRVSFENHDHVYKRTIPLRDGKADPNGIVFIGDGAWGVGTREVGRDQGGTPPWYLANSASTNHAIIVTLDGPHQHFLVVDHTGTTIDEYPARPSTAAAPR